MDNQAPTMTIAECDAAIAATPAPRVTTAQIEAAIKSRTYRRLTDRLTHCIIELENGFIVTGESACVCAENYDRAVGEKYAQEAAFDKLWPLFGFALRERVAGAIAFSDQVLAQESNSKMATDGNLAALNQCATSKGPATLRDDPWHVSQTRARALEIGRSYLGETEDAKGVLDFAAKLADFMLDGTEAPKEKARAA